MRPGSHEIELIVLAGGNSARMGHPKWQLLMPNGETFLSHLLRIYDSIGVRAASVIFPLSARENASRMQDFKLSTIVKFLYHGKQDADRTASIIRGLSSIRPYSNVFLQDVDRPIISVELLRDLIDHLPATGYGAPDIDGHAGHPVLLSSHCAQSLLHALQQQPATSLRDVLRSHPARLVKTAISQDININTPADYDRYVVHDEVAV